MRKDGADIAQRRRTAADDRLAVAAQAAGIAVHVLANPKLVPGDAIPEGTGLIVAAHTHARVSNEALARSRLGGIGYHPSLLPRHRGIAAVEWTILSQATRSRAAPSITWPTAGTPARSPRRTGVSLRKSETARELWERALAPMGLALLTRVVRHAASMARAGLQAGCAFRHARADDPPISFAHRGAQAMIISLVVTVIGPDRPGIVASFRQAQGFGANWAGSRMASLAGQFAGMVHFEVPPDNADALAAALRALESPELPLSSRKATARPRAGRTPTGQGRARGSDRPGIVRDLSRVLAHRGVSIEEFHTEIVSGAMTAEHLFKVKAVLLVPKAVTNDDVRHALEALANEMMVDVALGGDGTATS